MCARAHAMQLGSRTTWRVQRKALNRLIFDTPQSAPATIWVVKPLWHGALAFPIDWTCKMRQSVVLRLLRSSVVVTRYQHYFKENSTDSQWTQWRTSNGSHLWYVVSIYFLCLDISRLCIDACECKPWDTMGSWYPSTPMRLVRGYLDPLGSVGKPVLWRTSLDHVASNPKWFDGYQRVLSGKNLPP